MKILLLTILLFSSSAFAKHLVHQESEERDLERERVRSLMSAKHPLYEAVKTNDLETALSIMNAGMDYNMTTWEFVGEKTLLQVAVENNHPKMAEMLLERGADPNYRKKSTLPSLYYAIKAGSLDLVERLVEAGADIHFGENYYLQLAQTWHEWEIAAYFRNLGLKVY